MSTYLQRAALLRFFALLLVSGLFIASPPHLGAQGPSPETGATLFPGGAFVSYNSIFTTRRPVERKGVEGHPRMLRPTWTHEAPITFGWGFHRDFQFTAVMPIVTDHLAWPAAGYPRTVGGTGSGDLLLLLKYRFLRLDSPRGTTQAALTIGPKLPTGRTHLHDDAGVRLPAGVQPGSGATDLFLNLSGTYTGLFHIKRLVADESITYWRRTEGAQQTRPGDALESRFWLSYRPYQSRAIGAEWWVGPSLTWQRTGVDRLGGVRLGRRGEDMLALGASTYFSPRIGTIFWFGVDFPVAQNRSDMPVERKHRYSFGITRQFTLHR